MTSIGARNATGRATARAPCTFRPPRRHAVQDFCARALDRRIQARTVVPLPPGLRALAERAFRTVAESICMSILKLYEYIHVRGQPAG